jgi:phenylacetate-CoA ligase
VRRLLYDALPIFAQNLACTAEGYRRSRSRFTPHFYRTLTEWEASAHGPLEKLIALQRRRLDVLVQRARQRVPYYRDLPPPSDHPDDREAIARTLATVEPVEKPTFREKYATFLADDRRQRELVQTATSGTTGTPLLLWHTPERIGEGYAAVWRQRRAFGAEMSDPFMAFGGQVVVPLRQTRPPYWRTNAYNGQTLFSIYHMSPSQLVHYVDAIHRTRATYVQGYPSALHLVARAMLDAGRALPEGRLVGVFTSSESLLTFQRESIEKAFGAPVRDHYAASELVVSMTACELDKLHVDMEFGIVEVEVQDETDEWERGSLVVTGLGEDATVLLRYRIRDIGTRLKKPCECGRPGDVFREVDGRVEDYVATPDGRLIGRLDHIFKEQFDVAEAQILQEDKDSIDLLVVPRPGYSERSEKKLMREVRMRLGDEIKVRIQITKAIPREPNGKFRAVRSEVGRNLP